MRLAALVPRTPWLIVAVAAMVSPMATGAQQSDQTTEAEARDWVGSIAAATYVAAWPTATYESARVKRVDRLPDGLSVLVRLTGTSGFGGGTLWVDLAFTFRKGQLFDMEVRKHNAILKGPFETTRTIAAATMEFAQEFAAERARRSTTDTATPPARPVFIKRSLPDGSFRLLLRRAGQEDRILEQVFSADTRLNNAALRSVHGMQIVSFHGESDEWDVQYWWHLGSDGLYYAARHASGRWTISDNFETGANTVGARMRTFVLDPFLEAR